MDKQRVEELLKLYFSEKEEEKLMSHEKDVRLLAHLKDLVEQEEAEGDYSTKVTLRKTLLLAAAAIIALLTMILFPESRIWRVEWVKDRAPIKRGDQDHYLYSLKIKPAVDGFIHILSIDPSSGCSFIFPFLDGEGPDDFGLSGPFAKGKEIRIPPPEYQGYAISGGDLFYVIPSKTKLKEENLLGLIKDLEEAIDFKKEDLQSLQRKIQIWFQSHYADAFLIKSFTSD